MAPSAPRNDRPRVGHLPPSGSARATAVAVRSERGAQVVVKSASTAVGIAAIAREASVLEQLRHPNVVELVRTGHTDEGAVVVTLQAGDTTLADVDPTGPAEVARLGAALLTVVGDLHAMGWAHGRIRVDHCVIDRNGRLTLCSWGRAQRLTGRDRRRATDLADAVAVIADLARRSPTPTDRAGRRTANALRAALAAAATDAAGPATAERLRRTLGDLAGAPTTRTARAHAADLEATAPSPRAEARAVSRRAEQATTQPLRRHARRGRMIGVASAGTALVALVGAVWFLRWIGGPLGVSGADVVRATTDLPMPVRLALDIVRIIAFGACLYGIALSAATLAACLTRRPDIARLATSMAPPRLRRWLVTLIGLGVLSSVGTGRFAPTGTSTPTAPTTTTIVASTSVPTTSTNPTTTTPPAPDAVTGPTPDAIDRGDGPAVVPQRPPSPAVLPNLWVMSTGDHLWGVSEAALSAHFGRDATSDEIDDYWRRVVQLNRGSLLDPDNPDLVFTGQVIELPPFP